MSPTTINREAFLQQLESVQAGIAEREVIEQSSCFIFKAGRVITFNDEIAVSSACEIGIAGAVRAKPLIAILRKLHEEELDVSMDGGEMLLTGTRREVRVIAEKEIQLPIDTVEKPEKWKKLDESFIEAIELVQHCASSDEAQFMLTCVHITPEHVEACDNAQLTRVLVATPVKQAVIVRRDSIKHIVTLGMTEIAETESWMHFRNPMGLVLSCRRFVENYLDLGPLLKFKGDKITLPKGLAQAADKAAIFAAESTENANVLVELRPGKLRLTGKGASGSYKETRKIAYEGAAMRFAVSPALLMDITKRYNDAEISPDRLRIKGGKWTYVACLVEDGAEEKKVKADAAE